MAKISVIIPTYNCGKYLNQTIDSVLSQDYGDVEVIVIDDGSTDNSSEIAAGYREKVQLISQENAGVCVARNRGIHVATGEYICLMDHDDYWFSWKLRRQLEAFAEHPQVGVVFSAFVLWHRDRSGTFPAPGCYIPSLPPDEYDPDFTGWLYHLFLLDCWMLTSTAMFKREVFSRCGVFDPNLPYSEDWDLWLRISREFQFAKLARPTTLYRQHPEQGNRISRPVDYRTMLLESAVAKWGYCSPDGRCLDSKAFRRQLGIYHSEYAFAHLKGGSRMQALKSFARAWWADPQNPRYLAYIPATIAGWRPSW